MSRPPCPTASTSHERDGCVEACRRLAELVELLHERDVVCCRDAGPHARHCVEHIGALLRGIDVGRVDYDARRRDVGLERSATRLLHALDGMVRRLERLDTETLARPIDVLQIAAPGASACASPSSVRRELAFLSSHTIHHLALMAAVAARYDIPVPEELLLAFSTAAHRQAASG